MKLFAPILLVPLMIATADAQQANPDTVRLADRSVTATKISAVRGVAPTLTTVISGDDMRARGVTFVTDALHDVPGIMIVPNGSYGAITSVFLRGGESDYIKVLLDGVPLNQPGGSIYLADLTTDNLDRIEIVRGPVSVLYGADAVSGVIQLFTREGRKHVGGSASAWRGTFGNALYDLGASGKFGNSSLSLGGSDFTSDGTYAFNNNYHNQVGSLQLDHRNAAGRRLAFTARYGDARNHYPTDYTGIAVDSNQFARNRSLALGASASGHLAGAALIAVQAFSSRLRTESDNRSDSPGDTLDFGYASNSRDISSRLGGDARIDWSHTNGSVLSVGLGYEREKQDQHTRTLSNYGFGVSEDLGDFSARRNTKSVYTQAFLTPSQFVTLQLGARLDDNSAFGNFVTYRGGLAFDRLGTRVWVSGGTAFKAPTFSELFAQSAYEVGNAALDPERSSNVEIGFSHHNAGSRVVVGVTAFAQRFRDMIQYVSAAPGESNYSNLGGADSRGLEGSLALKANDDFRLRASWTLLHTEVTDSGVASTASFAQGERLLRRPLSSGNVTATWLVSGATLSGVINFIGERDDVDFRKSPAARTTLPSYQTVDLSIAKPLTNPGQGGSRWDLMLRGENLFDTSYEQVVAFPGRGRTLFIGVRSSY